MASKEVKLTAHTMTRTLILGIGNILLQDEGVGVHVIEHIRQQYSFPEEVQVLDGATMGLDLLYYIEDIDQLLVVDAIDANQPPGTIVCLSDDEISSFLGLHLSVHQVGLADVLSLAKLRGKQPPVITIIGIQPASLDVGTDLSPTVTTQLPALVEAVIRQLHTWGIPCTNSQ